ncbi:hypothetical protein TH15_15870 [Thalassospira profundimaris]|uniref:Tyr recombinase domain-containing protein n=2 Tax=Thalassospira indica TaxID=1891279 RepID=A0ABM6Y0H7_9PROT|nr:hypothetical protein DY252_15385 [Thalassospira indica]OAZ12446.1 hypothetical protein TH15_15870 [Thalassospira profundimaris]
MNPIQTATAYHLMAAEDLRETRINRHSRWYDDRWFFDNLTPGHDATASTIRWDFIMPDGSKFVDPKWAILLDAHRRLVWSLIVDPRQRHRYKPGSMGKLSRRVLYLARWMGKSGYAHFGALDTCAFDQYLDNLLIDKQNKANLNAVYLMEHLALPVSLGYQAPVLAKAGIPVPGSAPWHGMTAFEVAKQLAGREQGYVPPVPDPIFLHIMTSALCMLDAAEDIILQARHFADTKDLQVAEKHAPDRKHLRDRMNSLTDACLILIQGLSGIRVSELLGLQASDTPLAQNALPDCIKIEPSASGLHEIFYLSGHIYKTTKTPRPATWVTGLRPVGSDHLPVPVKAISVIERLYAPWRTRRNINELIVGFSRTKSLTKDVKAHTLSWVNRCQRRFFVRSGVKDWTVTSHQWRKSFAQYVIRSDSRMLPVLQEHFKHISMAMTEQGYINADPELKQILDDAAVQSTVSLIGEMIAGRKNVTGALSGKLKETANQLGRSLDNRPEDDRRRDIEELVRTSGIRAHDIRWGETSLGTCLFRQGTGNCTVGCSARWVISAPLWSAARPDLCWECQNLVLDETHLPFWKDRRVKLQDDLKTATTNDDFALAQLCKQRLEQCIMVLNKLETTETAAAENSNPG